MHLFHQNLNIHFINKHLQRTKILTSKNGTEVDAYVDVKKIVSGSFVFKFTAGKVVKRSNIIRKDSFIS